MKEKLLKDSAKNSILFMTVIIIAAFFLSITAQHTILADGSKLDSNLVNNTSDANNNDNTSEALNKTEFVIEVLGEQYIKIDIGDKTESITLKDLYMERKIELILENVKQGTIPQKKILRVNKDKEFTTNTLLEKGENKSTYITIPYNKEEELLDITYYSKEGKNGQEEESKEKSLDPVIEYSIEYRENKMTGKIDGIISLTLNDIYAHFIYQEDNYIYIDLRRPKDIYEKIVVIDAGHGGKDPGTHSLDKKYYEKDMNLEILFYLKEIIGKNIDEKEGLKVYYTRTGDETIFLNPRVNFANDVEADLFLSIHCNAVDSPNAYGAEVLFNEKHISNVFSSKDFAKICLDEIVGVTGRVNRGLVEASDKVVVGNANMPVALVEIGFMTNPEELAFLLKDSNKEEIAQALYRSINKGLKSLSP